MKLRAARHPERRSLVMGQHKKGSVIRRLVAPPPFPGLIRPRASDGANMFRSSIQAPNPASPSAASSSSMPVSPPSLPCIRCQVPVWRSQSTKCRTANAEGILQILAQPGAEPIDRDREAMDPQSRHGLPHQGMGDD